MPCCPNMTNLLKNSLYNYKLIHLLNDIFNFRITGKVILAIRIGKVKDIGTTISILEWSQVYYEGH